MIVDISIGFVITNFTAEPMAKFICWLIGWENNEL